LPIPASCSRNGVFNRAKIILDRTAGGALLTIELTAGDGTKTTPVSGLFIGGMNLVGSRMQLSGQGGGSRADHDIDNVSITGTAGEDDAAALTLNETVSGSVTRAGGVYRHVFTVTEPTAVVFDALTNNGISAGRLPAPPWRRMAGAFTATDAFQNSGNPVHRLAPGTYTVAISAANNHTEAMPSAVLAGGGNADPIDAVTGGGSTPANRTALFRFDAAAGERLFFDRITGSTDIAWRLVAPSGAIVFGPDNFNDLAEPLLQETGTYTLLVEGRLHHSSPQDFSFRVGRISDDSAALGLGNRTTGEISLAGQRDRYTFSWLRGACCCSTARPMTAASAGR
jgi:hypothetical protein